MSKFIKTLFIINGLLIPVVLIVFLVFLIVTNISNNPQGYRPESVNKVNTIIKDGDTLISQGLRYKDPEPVYNSTNFMIKVMPKTYDEPRQIESTSTYVAYRKIEFMDPEGYLLNILFLDANYNVISKLVDKKASIESVTIPTSNSFEKVDTTVKNIGYLIAFVDSNNDKRIDWNDNYDLYISDLDGKNLYQVTKDSDIKSFSFINNHKEIFISYTDRSDIRDEYKITRFALFNIGLKQLNRLTDIDKALGGIQKILN